MNAAIKDALIELSKKTAWSDNDNFAADDYSGQNFDDAYSGGFRDGQIEMAREVIDSGILDAEPIGQIEELSPAPVATSMAPVQDESYWMRRCAHAEARLVALETFIAQMADK